ncbi:MAG: carboxymuconolactone decarboxylase family protein [Bryobacteraceae bacterium]|nr:carboxymuconolactone decarboxylase family protein [Bryobacterales bacterium]MEB2360488.1 carboxymuconolactone decarboxylase family protein [Bryobacterales bacterium]NUN02405.1 carboxymuconolactone decarboxylase family protein [Bryobacteraceae bacterium]
MTEKSEVRLDYYTVAPAAMEPLLKMEQYIRSSGLEPALLELVKLRASIINGCAYCVDMHTKDARAGGESEQRLYAVSVWHEAPFFTPRERAALAWTDTLTRVSAAQVPDEIYNLAREHFSERELVDLTMAVIAINGWNRLAIAFRAQAGTYEPGQFTHRKRGQAT